MPEFKFQLIKARIWKGRYRKPAGKEPTYHVSSQGDVNLIWYDDGLRAKCPVIVSAAVKQMADAVNSIKRAKVGQAGGSFVINEFGQVISPIMESRDRYLVGECEGILYFENSMNRNEKTSLDSSGMKLGAEWKKPYIGMAYNLDQYDRICFRKEDDDGCAEVYPSQQDTELIKKLRTVREVGYIRFIVNQYGVALTKKEINGNWKAIYIGQINYNKWFSKEG